MEVYLGLIAVALAGFGSLWYRVGKLVSEVKGHNQRLDKIEKVLEELAKGR